MPFPIIFFFIPRRKKFEPILEDARSTGEITPQLREHLHDPAMGRMHLVEMAGVVFIVYTALGHKPRFFRQWKGQFPGAAPGHVCDREYYI